MAQLHWTPQTVWHDATLRDIAEAYHARHCKEHSALHAAALPDAKFLHEMMQRFPDHTKPRSAAHGQ